MSCKECGKGYSEKHHIVFRSQQKALEHCKINIIELCGECHRGNTGPHKNRKKDLEYKKELQEILFEIFGDKEKYTEKEISMLLEISELATRRLVKTLNRHIDKYTSEDIIRSCMGGRLY